MAVVAPEILELLEQVRQQALSYENAEENFPWGNRVFFRDLKGRNFLFANTKNDYLEVTFRLPKAQKEQVLALPFVEPSRYMSNWVNANVRTQAELDQISPWIKVSYKLNKPFRSQSEVLPGEAPEVLDFLEQVREAALRYEDVEEYFPYGDRAFRLRKGKIFVYIGEGDDYLSVSVRLPLGEREYALSLPFIEVPKYIGHQGWVQAKVRTQSELDTVLPWVAVSYEVNNPPRKTRAKKVS